MKNELHLSSLKNAKELKTIEEFKKIFKQEFDCDGLIIDLIIECIKIYSYILMRALIL